VFWGWVLVFGCVLVGGCGVLVCFLVLALYCLGGCLLVGFVWWLVCVVFFFERMVVWFCVFGGVGVLCVWMLGCLLGWGCLFVVLLC